MTILANLVDSALMLSASSSTSSRIRTIIAMMTSGIIPVGICDDVERQRAVLKGC